MRARSAMPFALTAMWLAACGAGPVPSGPTPAVLGPSNEINPAPAMTAAPASRPVATEGPPTPAPTASVTFTMDDAGCMVTGPTTLDPGRVVLELDNASSGQFDADLWRLDSGHGYNEFAAHAAEEQRRWQEGLPPLGHPAFATLVAEASVPGAHGTLTATVVAGTYGLACIRFVGGAPVDIWSAGPLTITG